MTVAAFIGISYHTLEPDEPAVVATFRIRPFQPLGTGEHLDYFLGESGRSQLLENGLDVLPGGKNAVTAWVGK